MGENFWSPFLRVNAGFLLLLIILGIIIVFIFRELTCWYFKTTRLVELLESIDSRLSNLENGAVKEISNHMNNFEQQVKEDSDQAYNSLPQQEIMMDKDAKSQVIEEVTSGTDIHIQNDSNKSSLKDKIFDELTKKRYLSDLFNKKSSKDE